MSRVTRREVVIGLAGLGAGALASYEASRYWLFNHTAVGVEYTLRRRLAEIERSLLPDEGKTLPVAFNGSVEKLVDAGVIDVEKWNRLYAKRRQTVPDWLARAMREETPDAIHFDSASASFLLNLLWALGLSNRADLNRKSPVNGKRLARYASTAGWKLGRAKNGAAYFNKVANVTLTEEQDRRVEGMAESIYRPCCNNSTLFQDCNHGSAMLGLLELGASQGLGEQELYAAALTANVYWFPTNYSKVALYYEAVEKRPIAEVPPQEVLSQRMSSSSGYRENVVGRLEEAKLMPQTGGRGSGGCSV